MRLRFALNGLVLPIEFAQLLLMTFSRLLGVALHGGNLQRAVAERGDGMA
jgi:hypothetical protein